MPGDGIFQVSTVNPQMSNPSDMIYDVEVEPFLTNKVKFHLDREQIINVHQSMRFDWWVKQEQTIQT